MTLTAEQRADFVAGYTRLLVTSWSDDAVSEKIDSDPVGALDDAGIHLPTNATIHVERPAGSTTEAAPGESGIDAQVELYEQGLTSNEFTFYVPSAPLVPTEQLDSGELHGVAAGGAWDPYCCSCCPNCCSASGG